MAENITNSNTPSSRGPRPPRTFSPRASRPSDSGTPTSSQYRGPQRSFGQNSSSRFPNRPGSGTGSGQPSRSGPNQRPFGGTGSNRFQNKRRSSNQEDDKNNFKSKVVQVRRVTRVVKGGKRMRFSALVVIGDLQGQFGVGLKKGNDYADAVNKATNQAKKNLHKFVLDENGSIPYSVTVKFKAAKIFLKPAVSGTGLIAGGPIRSILELAGVRNVLSKIIGSNNKISNVMAINKALSSFTTPITK